VLYTSALEQLYPGVGFRPLPLQCGKSIGIQYLYYLFCKSTPSSNPENTLMLMNGNTRFWANRSPKFQEFFNEDSASDEFNRRNTIFIADASVSIYNSAPKVSRFTKMLGRDALKVDSPSSGDYGVAQAFRPNRKLDSILDSPEFISWVERGSDSQYFMGRIKEGRQIRNVNAVGLGKPDGQGRATASLAYRTVSEDKSHPIERIWANHFKSGFVQRMAAFSFRKCPEWYPPAEQESPNSGWADAIKGSELNKVFSRQVACWKLAALFLRKSALHVFYYNATLNIYHNAAINILRLGESLASKQNCMQEVCI
jgi:hypothetical protein